LDLPGEFFVVWRRLPQIWFCVVENFEYGLAIARRKMRHPVASNCRHPIEDFAENHVGKRIAKEALIQIEVAPQAATVTMKRNGRIQRYSFLTACHLQKFWLLHFAFLTMQ